MRRVIFPFYLHPECWNERRANWFTLECKKKKPVKAYSMYLKMLYRLISVRFTQEFEILTLFYFRSWVSLPVFFLDTHSVKTYDGFNFLLAADYPFTIWVKTDFLFCCSTLSNNKLKHLPKEVFSRNSNLIKL